MQNSLCRWLLALLVLSIAGRVDAAPQGARRGRSASSVYSVSRSYTPAYDYRIRSTVAPATPTRHLPSATNAYSFARTYQAIPRTAAQPVPTSTIVAYATHAQPSSLATPQQTTPSSGRSAIAEVNALRAQRGLPAFQEDPSLSAIARQKASIQAQRGVMAHPGGTMGGARYEGVGMGQSFISCYLYSNVGRTAGAASVRGANGQRFHCLLIR